MKRIYSEYLGEYLVGIYQRLEDKTDAFSVNLFREEIERGRKLLLNYKDLFEQFMARALEMVERDQYPGFLSEISRFRLTTLHLLETLFRISNGEIAQNRFTKWITSCHEILAEVEEHYYIHQHEDRFTPLPDDNSKIRIIKRIKRLLRGFQRAVYAPVNYFRRIFRLKPLQPSWKQKVPLRQIILTEMVVNYLYRQIPAFNHVLKSLSEMYLDIWKSDQQFNIAIQSMASAEKNLRLFLQTAGDINPGNKAELLLNKLQSIEQQFNESLELTHRNCRIAAETACTITGTAERKASHYNLPAAEKLLRATENELKSQRQLWNNTFFLLAEDWKLDLEIYSLISLAWRNYAEVVAAIDKRIIRPLLEKVRELNRIVEQADQVFKRIQEETGSDLPRSIERLKLEIKKSLRLGLIPAFNQMILDAKIPEYIDQVENTYRKQVDQLSKQRWLLKSTAYNRPVTLREAEIISPHALVTFELMPQLLQAFPVIKNNYINIISKVQREMGEIPEIIDFTLKSALSYFEEKGDAEQASHIATEGFSRVVNKTHEINRIVNESVSNALSMLRKEVDAITPGLAELTDNENAFEIKFRITKAKAIERVKLARKNLARKIRDFIPKAVYFLKSLNSLFYQSTRWIRKELENEPLPTFVSTDISDYLSETQESIEKLPYVYQQLFKPEPLEIFDLFIDRTDLIGQIKAAFDKWSAGKFAPVVITGETGSGKTSLVNRFIQLYLPPSAAERINLNNFTEPPENLFHTIESAIQKPVGGQLNAESKRYLVIEGLEKLFLADVDGFTWIRKMFQLIANTSHPIFWLCTCHEYSWEYLDRCISASDFFGYLVKINTLSDENLKDIIYRRNAISGYQIFFNPPVQEKTLNIFQRRLKTFDQETLRKNYFANLNSITGGNLTIALLYWMRSMAKVTEDTLYIHSLSELNLNFIKNIPKEKLLTLRSLIIHNGLTIKQYAQVFRISEERAHFILNQMFKDGILVEYNEMYRVNPLIYSQTVKTLKLQNLIT